MPKKVALFVEGATELSLVKRLVQELCGVRHVTFELVQQFRRTLVALRTEGPQNPPAETYVLIADCSQDGQVLTQIRDRYDSLVESGYEAIIGLRDLYPNTLADLPRAQAAINAAKPNGPVPVAIHFALTETEAWYLDEHTHFERIAPTLTLAHILANGFPITTTLSQNWPHPSNTLHRIYRLANRSYKKGRGGGSTLAALSFDHMYNDGRVRSASFDNYVGALEGALF